eukprot:gene3840-2720_t
MSFNKGSAKNTKKEDVDINVTWEDQQKICMFSRLYKKLQHLKGKHQRLLDDVEKLDDAVSEVMICSEVKYVFGEAFVDLPADEAGDLLEEAKSELEQQKEEVETEMSALEAALGELKPALYAKFGDQINLEDQ